MMNYRNIRLPSSRILEWGKQGENKATRLSIDVSEFIERSEGTIAVSCCRPDGKKYPHDCTINDTTVEIELNSYDTQVCGILTIVVSWMCGERIVKSEIYCGEISRSISTSGEKPTPPFDGLIEQVCNAAIKAKESADRAEAAADRAENIKETDPTVPAWAKQPEKPTYTAEEIGAQPKGDYASREDVDRLTEENAALGKQCYAITEMPIWLDRFTEGVNNPYTKLEILDFNAYGLVRKYGTSGDFFYLNPATLELKTLCNIKVGEETPNWYCGKIFPTWGTKDYMLLWDRTNHHVTKAYMNGTYTNNFPNQKLGWLRNQGIDISIDSVGYVKGTMMYAEYYLPEFGVDVDTVKVYRSTDLGASWTAVFEKKCRHNETGGEVFHFHFIRQDPYNPGHWYLGSGDIRDECNIWRSVDDGLTWAKINDLRYTGELQAIHRTCDLFFTKDYIYWATDDHLEELEGYKDAVWCKSPRNLDTNKLEITILADVLEQVRLTIQTPFGVLLATENHLRGKSLIWLVPYDDLDHPVLICEHEISFANQVMKHSYGTRWFAATAYHGNYPEASADSYLHVFDISRMSRLDKQSKP